MTATPKPCRDCVTEASGKPLVRPRPAPHPGPRCTTHHRSFAAGAKARAHDRHVQKTYGLPPGAYAALLAAQHGRCAICQKATGKARRLAVDHDHDTGEVRGLLCKPCNYVLLGRYSADALARAAAYLAEPPARAVLKGFTE